MDAYFHAYFPVNIFLDLPSLAWKVLVTHISTLLYLKNELKCWQCSFIFNTILKYIFNIFSYIHFHFNIIFLSALSFCCTHFQYLPRCTLLSLILSLQQCWVALCPSHLETALPSLLMSLHFGRSGRKARERNIISTTSADSSFHLKPSSNTDMGLYKRAGIWRKWSNKWISTLTISLHYLQASFPN